MAPTESAANAMSAGIDARPGAMNRILVEELWRACEASSWGLSDDEFEQILVDLATAQNFGLAEGVVATLHQQAAFFHGLCLADMVLARGCASGNERAWEHFVGKYRQPLIRAAVAITGSETLGRDLADQLYAELYGLTERDGARRCPLLSYRGRGSLMGWLRTTLAQRHVDHYRRTRREEPLEEVDAPADDPAPQTTAHELSLLELAVKEAVAKQPAEERYLLATYYLDGQTLKQIAQALGVHEATVSRKLQRATGAIRKLVLKNLERGGLDRRAAQDALGADPRDLDVNLKKLLQNSQTEAFQEQAAR
ncbi:RNA polymerase sigma factor, sigma-70 family [Candidatus Sulfotelmatomonas gaucii]|uniref:RNA polymerase sigma factor, sigma-70 family n=1 Tax=Candidatus Sulfuritelmatomonas gaucii TaxID=2043161 RepID=A0A2N9LAZ8_9BACT|nr:RNA polymerase sigma factor, sigma-70 family [Candidatus Sulfotelmatomonas gaucii]